MVDDHLATRLGDSIQKAFQSYTAEFEKKAQDEKKRYIDLIEKLVKAIINDEVKTQLPQILPKVVSDFATPIITSTVNESIENIMLAKSSSQPQSTYEAIASLTEFKLKKILLDKMQKSQSYQGAKEHKELYDGLVKSYKLDKDLFESYGKAYSVEILIQELLGYVRDTCPDIHKHSKKLVAGTPINKKKTFRFAEPVISSRVSRSTKYSRSKSTDNTKNDRILQISSRTQKKNKVEDHSGIVMSFSMFDARHKLCFLEFVSDMNARRTFTLVGNACPLTRITATNKVPLREPIPLEVVAQESVVTKVYTRRPKVVQIVLWYLDSGCSKHMTGDRSMYRQLTNFVHKFLGTVKFGNDQIAKIMGYGDYQIGNITISRVYYVEGLGHNLFSVGQFCDSDLEVAFRKHTCFVRNLEGVDLLSGSRETNLYTLSIRDMMVLIYSQDLVN
ncbi:hypothetical protein Tco_0774587 [Tanacetum coccineum]|uniref:Retrovirus-related Pol polyprotein from transposon TNT 1-94-like beta-barrel domain-containing protein n=1 Tax=Tanacetum coccineum TaxID=301880 RepID=A0ABQ4ZRH1_9ASTR